MSELEQKPAIPAIDVEPVHKKTSYPEPFAARVGNRVKRRLGDHFGLKNFGVNLTQLMPGSISALLHKHRVQDEFVYILQGQPTLVTEDGEQLLEPGMCVGFPANGRGHHLVNRSNAPVTYIEIGDRLPGDEAHYPNEDLVAKQDAAGKWYFVHKDGTPYA